MDLKDIASVSGKSGLFKVLKPTRTGVILETIDAQRMKVVANANNRVSLLKEISVYTIGEESSKPLESIFEKIHDLFSNNIPVDSKSTTTELTTFMEQVIPDYDKEKVYLSDIKKLVTWYTTLVQYFPERFLKAEKVEQIETVPALEEVSAENADLKKSKVKKAPVKKKTEE